jgi:hypothetical protein
VSAFAGGLSGLGSAPGQPGLILQAAQRLDGAAFAGEILQAEHTGQPRLSADGIPESLLLAVPSAAWPSKLDHSGGLNPYHEQVAGFGVNGSLLPGLPGLYAGFLTPVWLAGFMAVLGAGAGWAERWLLRSWSPARMVLLAGAVTAALRFEQGLPGMLLAFRTAVAIAIAVKLLAVARGRRHPVPQLT